MRPVARVQSLPPYLFAELERKIRSGAEGRGRGDLARDRRSRPAHPDRRRRGGAAPGRATRRRTGTRRTAAWTSSGGPSPTSTGAGSGSSSTPTPRCCRSWAARRASRTCASRCSTPATCAWRPTPGYPVYTSGTLLAGAEPVLMPLTAEHGFQPDLAASAATSPPGRTCSSATTRTTRRAPSSTSSSSSGWRRSGSRATCPSCTTTPTPRSRSTATRARASSRRAGAREAGVEMFSLSKAYNMTGWRVGAAVGNAEMIAALLKLKTNIDSGQFDAVQLTAGRAPRARGDGTSRDARGLPPPPRPRDRRARRGGHRRRRRRRGRSTSGCPVPAGHTSVSFAELVLEQAAVVVSPGSSYGPNGEGYVRLSLTVADDELREAVSRIEQHLRVAA